MLTVLLVAQVIITLALIAIILLQRNASDGLSGIGGGASGGGNLMSGRATANVLTRTTAVLAALFMINALAMATITARSHSSDTSIVDGIEERVRTDDSQNNNSSDTPSVPVAPTDDTPATDTPTVPVAE
jgi:preprotein translocase subunit SecG